MSQPPLPITLTDIEQAASRIAEGIVRTPTAVSLTLSEHVGATLAVKFENLQFTASFKERGALNRLLSLTEAERARGVVTMSAGNHAQGLAYHARRLGIPATIVMPAMTPSVKVGRTRVLGARVLLHGDTLEEAAAEAHAIGDNEGLTFVHPYDDAAVVAGQGTVALEFLADQPDIDTLVVPVGGGGLVAGVAIAVKAIAPRVEVIGVQSERHPAMAVALGRWVSDAPQMRARPTIAEGIAVDNPGKLNVAIARALVDDVVVVGERYIESAIGLLADVEKVVAEGAGAVGLAALLDPSQNERFRGRAVGTIVTGGNIGPRLLASVLLRELVRTGQLVSVRAEIDDRPGALSALTGLVAGVGGDIVEVRHSRLVTQLSINSAQVELTVEVEDASHAERLVEVLRSTGFPAERLEPHG